jgi:multiple sugar transport system substrate-binding protein
MITQKVDLSDNGTLVEQLVSFILKDLEKAKPGDKVLSERALAEKYNVSRITTCEAVRRLTEKGLLQRRVGRGTFVSEKINNNKIPCVLLNMENTFPSCSREKILSNANKNMELISTDCLHFDEESTDNYLDFVQKTLESGNKLDIISIDESILPDFAEKGLIVPVDDLLEKSRKINKTDFHPALLDSFRYQGKLYGLPQTYSNVILFYNKELFDRLGLSYPDESWTWQNLLETGERLTLTNEETTKKSAYGVGAFQFGISTFMPFVYQNLPPEVKLDCINIFERPETADAFQFGYDLIYKNGICTPIQNALDINLVQMFINGNLGMFIGKFDDYRELESKCDLEWGVAELPAGKRRQTTVATQGWAVTSLKPGKAFKALEQLLSPKNTEILCTDLRRLPARNANGNCVIPDVFNRSLEYAVPAGIGFPPGPQIKKVIQKEIYLMLSNFETPENLCRKLCEYSKNVAKVYV